MQKVKHGHREQERLIQQKLIANKMKLLLSFCLSIIAINLFGQDYDWGMKIAFEYGNIAKQADVSRPTNSVFLSPNYKKTCKLQLGVLGDIKPIEKSNFTLSIGLNLSYLHIDLKDSILSTINNPDDPQMELTQYLLIPNDNYILLDNPILFEFRKQENIGFVIGFNNQFVVANISEIPRLINKRYNNSVLFGTKLWFKRSYCKLLVNIPTSKFREDEMLYGLNMSYAKLLNKN